MPLFLINTQLAANATQIANAKANLQLKKEELKRIKTAQGDLISVRKDLLAKDNLALQPEFTPKTFHGKNANELNRYRENIVKESFRDIGNGQMMESIADMQVKINELANEINVLENSIAALGVARKGLIAQRTALLAASD